MAKGSDHIVVGMIIALCGIYFFRLSNANSFQAIVCFLACVAGSLFPDIDVKSKGQKLFYGIMAPFYIFLFINRQYYLCFCVGLTALLPILCKHRGLFHCWWFIVAFAGLWSIAMLQLFPLYPNEVVLGSIFFISGALSHLLLDFGLRRMIFH